MKFLFKILFSLLLLSSGGCSPALLSFQKEGRPVTAEYAGNILTSLGGRPDLLKFCEEILYLPQSRSLACLRNDNWGLIDQTGRLIIKPECANIFFNNFSEKKALANSYLCEKKGKFALFDHKGKLLAPAENDSYRHEKGFKKHIIVVHRGDKLGLLDIGGKTILNAEYDDFDCSAFYTGRFTKDDQVCQITKDGKVGIVRTDGELIFDAECDRVEVGGLINNWSYKCIKGPLAHYYSLHMELLRIAPVEDDIAGNYRRRRMP